MSTSKTAGQAFARACGSSGAAAPSAGVDAILATAAKRRTELGLAYAGAVTPSEASQLVQGGVARLVDVRTPEEYRYVGHVPGSTHVTWHGAAVDPATQFQTELGAQAERDETLLFMCRSGARSHSAATAAHAAGWQRAYNVLEGFEGQKDARQQRGHIDGWRKHGLPWVQD